MSTLPVAHPDARASGAWAVRSDPNTRAPALLAGALIALVAYAAFAHGAASNSADTRVEVAIAAFAVAAGAAGLWTGLLRLSAPRLALAGTALLAVFAIWNGVTVLWSVAPDQTWIELNRVVSYVIVLCLALALGASEPRALSWIAGGYLAVSLVVTAYALGQKLFPGLHVFGLVNLNQIGPLPRLQEPFGYWNALALFVAMGVPIALAFAADPSRLRRYRALALMSVVLMLLVLALTYSRGGMLALVVGLLAVVGLSSARLRLLMWLAVACAALAPPLVFALSNHALTTANEALSNRESAGLELAAVLLVSLLIVVLAARKIYELEGTVRVTRDRGRAIGRALGIGIGLAVLAAVVALALSSRGLPGTFSHEWNSFTTTRATSVYQPDRLLSIDSENRWVWWKEAAGAFSARPIEGWGAGSFPVVHRLYRRDTLSVNQPHSVPLQFLAESGVVGAVLAIVGFALLLVAAARGLRRVPGGGRRLLWAAMFAGAVMWAVHALYDWDWDIPGVTLPALVFLGVLGGSGNPRQAARVGRIGTRGAGLRAVSIALLTFSLCVLALSAVLPELAASKASAADVAAGSSSPDTVTDALAEAELAGRLDPLSDAGPRVEATIASRRGELLTARSDLLDAVRREPTDNQAWLQLTYVEFALHDARAGMQAAERAVALDPHASYARAVAANFGRAAALGVTPPQESPTAQPAAR